MQLLTPDTYRIQPWANGRGHTVELWRIERDGALLARLSMARVDQDGPFSLFPGIERNLTVISGPGFRLTGQGLDLDCRPLVPVAFPGDVPVSATGTSGGASDDLNVMTARRLPRPEVRVERAAALPAGGTLALLALEDSRLNDHPLPRLHLALTDGAARVTGLVLAARLAPGLL